MQTILSNGSTSNRLNIVILSEGYTSAQLPQFLAHATNAINALLSHAPYQEYRNYVNAFAIKVASTDSGSSHPLQGVYRNTYFNSAFVNAEDNFIEIPNDSTGQGKVDSLPPDLYAAMPPSHSPGKRSHGRRLRRFDKTAIASIAQWQPSNPLLLRDVNSRDRPRVGQPWRRVRQSLSWLPRHRGAEHHSADQSFIDQVGGRGLRPRRPCPRRGLMAMVSLGCSRAPITTRQAGYRPQLTCTMGSQGLTSAPSAAKR